MNKFIYKLKNLEACASFVLPSNLKDASFVAFSDASQISSSYGETGYIYRLYLKLGRFFHGIDWKSSKKSRFSSSFICAEIIDAATSTERGYLMDERNQSLYGAIITLPLVLNFDYHGLFFTINTVKEGQNCRLRPTAAQMRDSYGRGEVQVI